MYGAAASLASAMDDDKPVYFKKVNALLERTEGKKKQEGGGGGRLLLTPTIGNTELRTQPFDWWNLMGGR